MASRRSLRLRFNWACGALAPALASCVIWVSLLAGTLHALDPNKHVTQYMHTAWRVQDGSLPAGMYHTAQTSDGFLWFLSLPGDIYRFDGVRFLPWHLPAGAPMKRALNMFADHAGGLWLLGQHDIVRLKDGVVVAHFQLEGTMFQGISEAPDGSLWVAQRSADAPLCHVSNSVKCFGKPDGIPISSLDVLLSDGSGGFWLGANNEVVHWQSRVLETYQTERSKSGGSGIQSLTRGSDGSLWVGEGTGGGLKQLKNGAVRPFVTSTFDGSNVDVGILMFDRDGNLWVGTVGKGLFRIHGNEVDHYDHTNGLSGDSV